MPTDTWPIDSPMLPPLVLRPPHGPRIVRALVVILAVIFHVATAGWSLITNGPEGELASAALNNGVSLSAAGGTALLHGPLAFWLTQASMALFGGNEFAARLPASLAVVVGVFLTLRLTERLGTIWSGFVAALILLCSPGMFTRGRMLTPVPLTAALITATLCCLQRGSEQHCPDRRRWFLFAWIALAFDTLAGGWRAGAIPVATVFLLAVFYREARLRFRALLSWEGGLVLALTVAAMMATGFAPGSNAGIPLELAKPAWQLLCWQAGLLFPWSLLLLPAMGSVLLQLFARCRLEWDEAFPLAWLVAAVGLVMSDPAPTLFSSLLFWPPFAIWGALRLNTMHRRVFLYGCAFTVIAACAGLYLTQHLRQLLPWLVPTKAPTIAAIPDFFWPAVTPVAFIAMLAFVMFVGVAYWAETFQNRRFALLALFAAMIPAGFAFADIGAKFAPYFSDAALAGYIDAKREPMPVIYVDGTRFASSSLRFYLSESARHGLRPCNPPPSSSGWAPPMFLVTERSRLPYWKQALEGRFTIACESGENVLLSASN